MYKSPCRLKIESARGIGKAIALSLLLTLILLPVLSMAEGIQWQFYSNGLLKAKAERSKIFINFFATW